jgi:hypothetical protein
MNRDDVDSMHTCHDQCERPACVAVRKAVAAERNKLAAWMIRFGFATGHGDTMEQLLEELSVEIRERANTHQGVPIKEWVGLTDEERFLNDGRSEEEIEYAKAIEAKLKEKNS